MFAYDYIKSIKIKNMRKKVEEDEWFKNNSNVTRKDIDIF